MSNLKDGGIEGNTRNILPQEVKLDRPGKGN